MKNDNALALAVKAAPQARYCCLAHLRSLLDGVRARHRIGADMRQSFAGLDESKSEDPAIPTAHDDYCLELEASLSTPDPLTSALAETKIRHDNPQELLRARRVFALTLLVPILLVSATLLLFGSALDKPVFQLLQFSAIALAVPLSVSAGAWLARMFKHRHLQ